MTGWARSSPILILLLLTGCGFSLQDVLPGPTTVPSPFAGTPGSRYVGNWDFRFTITAVGALCGTSASHIGTVHAPVSMTVNDDGTFYVPQGSGATGKIDPSGTVTMALVGPPPATCPAGSGTGRCPDINDCNGTLEQGGDRANWNMVRRQ
jgi:hypothetical protein